MLVKDHYSLDNNKKSQLILPTDLLPISHEYPKKAMVLVGDQEYIGHQLIGIKY